MNIIHMNIKHTNIKHMKITHMNIKHEFYTCEHIHMNIIHMNIYTQILDIWILCIIYTYFTYEYACHPQISNDYVPRFYDYLFFELFHNLILPFSRGFAGSGDTEYAWAVRTFRPINHPLTINCIKINNRNLLTFCFGSTDAFKSAKFAVKSG